MYIKEEGIEFKEGIKNKCLCSQEGCKFIEEQKIKLTEEVLKLHQPNLYKSKEELKENYERNQLIKKNMLNTTVEVYLIRKDEGEKIFDKLKKTKNNIREYYQGLKGYDKAESTNPDKYKNFIHSTVNEEETENDIRLLFNNNEDILKVLHEINGDFSDKMTSEVLEFKM